MASIKKRGTSYLIKVSLGYSADGNQQAKFLTWTPPAGMTKRQIEKELNRQAVLFEEQCASGYAAKAVKFEEFMDQWFTEYAELTLKPNTVTGYRSMKPRIIKALGHIRMDKLTTRDIQKFIVDLCDTKRFDTQDKNDGKLSTKTIKLYKSFISTVCSYAVKMNVIKDNPCRNVTIPKVVSPEKEFYTIEETQQLFDLFEKEDKCNYIFVCFFTLAIYTGFRLGELLGLEWKDVNFDANVISVCRTSLYNKKKGGIYTETPKTAQSVRSLKVPEEVMDFLRKWQGLQAKQKEQAGDLWTDNDRIFTKWNGDPLHRSAPRNYFVKFCEKTGMRYVSCHSMRHLNASLLINAGIDVKTVQSCLGHSTPVTTLQVYSHAFQSAQAVAMQAVANAIPLNRKKTSEKVAAAS